MKTSKNEDEKLEIDVNNFNALQLVDREFSHSLKDLEVKDQKGMKVGKILASQFNAGAMIIDMPRLYKNGIDAKYFVDGDKQVVMWQPGWLELQDAQAYQEE